MAVLGCAIAGLGHGAASASHNSKDCGVLSSGSSDYRVHALKLKCKVARKASAKYLRSGTPRAGYDCAPTEGDNFYCQDPPKAYWVIRLSAKQAVAHPGHGAISVTVDGDGQSYEPAEVTIGVNDAVIWFWTGVVSRNHSVTADPGQAESFDSDPEGPPTNATHPEGDSFSYTFRKEGAFTYHCQVHAGMTGVVNVVGLPTSTDLRLNGFRVVGRGDSIHTRFFLSSAADVVFRFTQWRSSRWHDVETVSRKGRKGRNTFDFPAESLEPGRYRLQLTAYDAQNQRAASQEPFALRGD